MSTTPYMSLVLPTPTVTIGPAYATQNNTAFTAIDSHNHTSGQGIAIPSAGILLNADLPFNSNNATLLRSTRFVSQGSVLSLPADITCLYAVAGNLYYNNASGQQIQLTAGAALNATSIGAIGGDYATSTASEFYTSASSLFTFWSAANIPAFLDSSSITIRPNSVSAPGVTLAAPGALSSPYTLTLPLALPVSNKFLALDASGNISTSVAVTGGITRANLSPPGHQISSSNNVTTSTGSLVAVSGTTVTITTSGNPILLIINGAFAAQRGTTGQSGYAVQLSLAGSAYKAFGTTQAYDSVGGATISGAPSYVYMDAQAAGTYTYGVMVQSLNASTTLTGSGVQITAYEIK